MALGVLAIWVTQLPRLCPQGRAASKGVLSEKQELAQASDSPHSDTYFPTFEPSGNGVNSLTSNY